MELTHRPRRLRGSDSLRRMVRETRISPSSLIYPLFVRYGHGIKEEIPSMPGQYRYSLDRLPEALEETAKAGISSVMLFGVPEHKDESGSGAWDENGIIQQALKTAKQHVPELFYITDICLCEYTSHGHCGLLDGQNIDNDASLSLLSKTALSHVQAGADMVAPSDMMDGRVGAIRTLLDQEGFSGIPVMSYAAKYSSAFYQPFRDAAGSAPAFGDRKSYQMDYHNSREALKEIELDIAEGADIIMVKPALSYLDIICRAKQACSLPVAAYSVSGEYAMIKSAVRQGWVDEAGIVCEMTAGIFRAGADILLTYYAKELTQWIKEGRIG